MEEKSEATIPEPNLNEGRKRPNRKSRSIVQVILGAFLTMAFMIACSFTYWVLFLVKHLTYSDITFVITVILVWIAPPVVGGVLLLKGKRWISLGIGIGIVLQFLLFLFWPGPMFQ